jgi:hypothetical protein
MLLYLSLAEALACRVESEYRDVLFCEPKDGIYSTTNLGQSNKLDPT